MESGKGVWIYPSTAEGEPEEKPIFVGFTEGETKKEDVIERLNKDPLGYVFFEKEDIDRLKLIESILRNSTGFKLGYISYSVNYKNMCLSFWENKNQNVLYHADLISRFLDFNCFVIHNNDFKRIEVVVF